MVPHKNKFKLLQKQNSISINNQIFISADTKYIIHLAIFLKKTFRD